jgi:SAM-dependent methyltransferase
MWRPNPELADHPDRLRWNARYGGDYAPTFEPHPLAVTALRLLPAAGPVLELASGPSGSALLAVSSGRPVTAVDASDVALAFLGNEAARRGLTGMLELIQADLAVWRPAAAHYALVLCTNFWDRGAFDVAVSAVADEGVLAWEALTAAAHAARPELPTQWCVGPGEPASLLPAGFEILDQHDVPAPPGQPARKRPRGGPGGAGQTPAEAGTPGPASAFCPDQSSVVTAFTSV